MNRFIEILAMALGGLSLFSVCFFGFAVLTGKPLSGIPGIGKAFATPEIGQVEPGARPVDDAPAPAGSAPEQHRSNADVVAAGIGVMGAWSLPSPYTPAELKALADELKSRLVQLDARKADLDRREQKIEDDARAAKEQFDVLESMRTHLEEYEAELELREQEIQRGEEAQTARERQVWSDQAGVLKGLSDKLAGERLITYSPEEAAHILRSMDPDNATKILNEVAEDSWREYVDAYTATAPPGKKP